MKRLGHKQTPDKGAKHIPSELRIAIERIKAQRKWSKRERERRAGIPAMSDRPAFGGRTAEFTGPLGMDGGDDYQTWTDAKEAEE